MQKSTAWTMIPTRAAMIAGAVLPVAAIAVIAPGVAAAQEANVPAKEAFEAAKTLGTIEAWTAFLASYPDGFYSDLARAYIKRLADGGAPPSAPATPAASPSAPATLPKPPATVVAPAAKPAPAVAAPAIKPPNPAAPVPAPPQAATPAAKPAASAIIAAPGTGTPASASGPDAPAVARRAQFMGFAEQFNRYYTDAAWTPAKTIFVSPDGGGDGASAATPMAAPDALAAVEPGTMIRFLPGAYKGGLELTKEQSGTYDAPIVLLGERKADKSIGVTMDCKNGTRQACFNFEGADYIAVDGFELIGGKFGVRAIGVDYAASKHSRGVAVLNTIGHDQDRDPFFSGAADWAVWERLVAYGAGRGDGHGIYLSNAGDWNIVRFSETYSNDRSDFQINADPNSTCKEVNIPFDDPRCDAYAGEGEGGQGASDYFLVEGNYFHHGNHGSNFTSVRRSVVRNNIFGPQSPKHNTTFWQETDNPKLGSSDNKILHNVFISTQRHGVKFENNSTRNEFANNLLIGVTIAGGKATANPKALLMEVDDTSADNVYRGNFYTSGVLEGRQPNDQEIVGGDFSPAWFTKFPLALNHDANDLTPVAGAPFLGVGTVSPDAAADRNGAARSGAVDLGPIEIQ